MVLIEEDGSHYRKNIKLFANYVCTSAFVLSLAALLCISSDVVGDDIQSPIQTKRMGREKDWSNTDHPNAQRPNNISSLLTLSQQ